MAWLLGLALLARGASVDEALRREYAITGFKPPPRWELLPRERPSYPQLLGVASRGQGADRAVITLTAKRLAAGTTLQQFAQEAAALSSRPHLTNLRVQIATVGGWFGGQRAQIDAVILEQNGVKHPQAVRQLLFMNPPFGYVLTLVAPQEQAAARYRDLDDTVANLVPLSPASPPPDLGAAALPAAPSASPLDGSIRPDGR